MLRAWSAPSPATSSFASATGTTRCTSPRYRCVTVDDGPGDDQVDGANAETLFLNGAGDDVFRALGPARFIGGPGADRFYGAEGFDTLSYATETQPVRVDATTSDDEGAADDGVAGEGDAIGTRIERIEGGSGDDDILAGGLTREVVGGAGADTLRGPAGVISGLQLDGGDGPDILGAGGSSTVLLGGAGDDLLRGSPAGDLLDGGAATTRCTVAAVPTARGRRRRRLAGRRRRGRHRRLRATHRAAEPDARRCRERRRDRRGRPAGRRHRAAAGRRGRRPLSGNADRTSSGAAPATMS